MKYLVSYATEGFYEKQKVLNESAFRFGINEVFSYTDKMLKETDFYQKNKGLLDQVNAPGSGYWVWKPYVISQAMNLIKEGDMLFYIDSGAEIISDIQPLVDLCKKQGGILLFNAVNLNKFYTKRDCFIKMKCDNEKYWNASQCMGGYQIYIKNKKSMEFIKENLKYVQIPELVDSSPSVAPNFKGFITHRHDQSILSLLAVKYNIQSFRNPSQGGNYLKKKGLRVKGEFLLKPYVYSKTPDETSNYPTILYNKRNASELKLFLIKLNNQFHRWLVDAEE